MTSAGKRGVLIVLCGPSGVGKSTIAKKLAERLDKLKYIVSATTRSRRPGDEQGKIYDHISREAFFRRLDQDGFLEYARVYDEYYGTPKEPALTHIASGDDVLLEIDVQGAFQIRFQYPDALLVFVLPPDEETLLSRLTERGRDTKEDIEKRFRMAKREIHMAKGSRAFDHYVFNDDIDRAVEEVVLVINQKKQGGI
jgi:guanylate kinase